MEKVLTNRIQKAFSTGKKVLNIYFTAGYPQLSDTRKVLKSLQDSGVDMVEIGMPYSDPLADGPTIQKTSSIALDNGMSIKVLFEQLKDVRKEIHIPIILMGYLNPVLQYGVKAFCEKCKEVGVDGVIIPDLPLHLYKKSYQETFEKNDLKNVLLVTPQTSEERIKEIDDFSDSFIYIVSTSSTTGSNESKLSKAKAYFDKVNGLGLSNPKLIGFNVKDKASFEFTSSNAEGAIIGSAFVKSLSKEGEIEKQVSQFIQSIR